MCGMIGTNISNFRATFSLVCACVLVCWRIDRETITIAVTFVSISDMCFQYSFLHLVDDSDVVLVVRLLFFCEAFIPMHKICLSFEPVSFKAESKPHSRFLLIRFPLSILTSSSARFDVFIACVCILYVYVGVYTPKLYLFIYRFAWKLSSLRVSHSNQQSNKPKCIYMHTLVQNCYSRVNRRAREKCEWK